MNTQNITHLSVNHESGMSSLISTYDWSSTALGPASQWPQSLKTAIDILLGSPSPMLLFWGDEGILIYNDAYAIITQNRHLRLFGTGFRTIHFNEMNRSAIEACFTGQPLFLESAVPVFGQAAQNNDVDYNITCTPLRGEDATISGVLLTLQETQRLQASHKADAVVSVDPSRDDRASHQKQHVFLLELEDVLRPLDDPLKVQQEAQRLLGEYLQTNRVGYGDVDQTSLRYFTTAQNWTDGTVQSHHGTHDLAAFGPSVLEALRRGETLVIDDATKDPRTASDAHQAAFAALEMASVVCSTLIKNGRATAVLYVHNREPRKWTTEEIFLVKNVAERTWAARERAKAELALRESETRYRTLFDTIDEGFCVIEFIDGPQGQLSDFRYIEANPAFETQTGISNVLGKKFTEIFPSDSWNWIDLYRDVLESGVAKRFERVLDNSNRYLELFAFRVEPPERNQVAVIFQDITERRETERKLRRLNNQLEVRVAETLAERKILADLVENADAFVQVIDLDYHVLAINKAAADEFERMALGHPKIGESVLAPLHSKPDYQTRMKAKWDRALCGETFSEVVRFNDRQRGLRFLEMRFSPLLDDKEHCIGAYQFVYDVTERLNDQARLAETEEALRQAQKMETIGQLTGGVAHDFNNLLTPIVGALDLLRRRLEGDERTIRMTDAALQSAERARLLVQRLLAFSRRQHLKATAVDVTDLIHGMSDLVARSLGPQIELVFDFPEHLPPAHVDPNQLELALLNLAVNARDAMSGHGLLKIKAETVSISGHSKLANSTYIQIGVTDTGTGMDAETLTRAIEPFFTTKDVGRGTGLGLSSVHGLAAQSGGDFTLISELGHGTSAILRLPVSQDAVEAIRETPANHDFPDQNRHITILLVDDEALVRTGTAYMLADAGYQIIEAGSSEEALHILKDGADVQALVTDYAMPGMSGAKLIREARKLRPKLPVLMITGYANLSDGSTGGLPRLAKPFRQNELVNAVAQLLDPEATVTTV